MSIKGRVKRLELAMAEEDRAPRIDFIFCEPGETREEAEARFRTENPGVVRRRGDVFFILNLHGR